MFRLDVKKLIRCKTAVVALFSLVVFALSACEPADRTERPANAPARGVVTIGGKDFTEQHILLKLTSIYLKENGYEVREAGNIRSSVLRSALENGKIDLYWEYTGTALVAFHRQQAAADPDVAYARVKEIDRDRGLVWLDRTEINSPYVILMRRHKAEQLGVFSISALADLIRRGEQSFLFATNREFFERRDGLTGLEKRYGFEFPDKNVIQMDLELLYGILRDDQVDVAVGVETDGRITAFDLIPLEDDLGFFPAYTAVAVLRRQCLERYPELEALLNRLSARLDTQTMRRLNYLVDVEQQDIIEVAREWLFANQLL